MKHIMKTLLIILGVCMLNTTQTFAAPIDTTAVILNGLKDENKSSNNNSSTNNSTSDNDNPLFDSKPTGNREYSTLTENDFILPTNPNKLSTNESIFGNSSYSSSSNTNILNGWVELNNTWYYYINGTQKKGWLNINGTWYYLRDDGSMAVGWQLVDDKWYYFRTSGSMISDCWINVSGKWYELDKSGAWINTYI